VKYPLSELTIRLNAIGRPAPSTDKLAAHWSALWDGDTTNADPEVAQWMASLDRPRVIGAGVTPHRTHFVEFILPEGFGADRELIVDVDGVPSMIQSFS